jgi:hypothetical protein
MCAHVHAHKRINELKIGKYGIRWQIPDAVDALTLQVLRVTKGLKSLTMTSCHFKKGAYTELIQIF